jgi:hypothetical protein
LIYDFKAPAFAEIWYALYDLSQPITPRSGILIYSLAACKERKVTQSSPKKIRVVNGTPIVNIKDRKKDLRESFDSVRRDISQAV